MSQSPLTVEGEADAYHTGWAAISRLLRRGFSWSGNERDVVFSNRGGWRSGGGGFLDVSGPAGLDLLQDGRAAVPLDWDHDGDLDLVVTSRSAPRVRVLRNDQRSGNGWMALRLVGSGLNLDAVGARVEVGLEGGLRDVVVGTRRAGEGFLAQQGGWVHLGLGSGTPRSLRVRWPGGEWESFEGARKARHLTLVQGSGVARVWPAPSAARALPSGPPSLAEGSASLRVLPRLPLVMPTLEVRTGYGQADRGVRLFGVAPGARGKGAGRPVLITLFSHTCAPCAGELAALGAAAADFREASLDLLALSVDPVEEGPEVAAFLSRTGFQGTDGRATPETLATLDAIQASLLDRDRHLPVPTSFLVDAEGLLQAVYFGPVDAEVVLRDKSLAGLGRGQARELVAQAAMGRLLEGGDRNPVQDLEWFEDSMRRRGLPGVAQEISFGRVDTRTLDEASMQLEFGQARLRQGNLEAAERHFRAASELDPTSADAWKGLGYCLHRRGDLAGARSSYLEVLRFAPDDERNRVNLGLVCHALGEAQLVAEIRSWLAARRSPLLGDFDARIGRQ